jgi:hypothetical protein
MGLHRGSEFFVATRCFVPPFRKAKFCAVPSRIIVKVGGVVGKERVRITALKDNKRQHSEQRASTHTRTRI